MIYLVHGTDTEKVQAKGRQLTESLVAKKPDVSINRYTAENFQPAELDTLIGGQGLFVSRLIVELNRIFTNAEYKTVVLENLKRLATSENIFIVIEGKLLKSELKSFEKQAEKIQEYELSETAALAKKKNQAGSPFALTDALSRRDKKTLWTLYIEKKSSGSVAEELHGLLFWQIKVMLLAAESPSAEAAGLKPFVYIKAKQGAANFSTTELHKLSSRMVSAYHDAHRGLGDLDLLLERIILEL